MDQSKELDGTSTLIRLGDVVERHMETCNDPIGDGFNRFVKVKHFDLGSLQLRRWGDVNLDSLPPTFRNVFREGAVLFPTRSPELKQYVVAEFDGICGEKTLVLKSQDRDKLLPEFLPFVAASDRFYAYVNSIAVGSVNAHVRWRDVADFRFHLPAVKTQRQIATILASADEAIEAYKIAVRQCDRTRKVMLMRLLAAKDQRNKRQETPLGLLPRSWKVSRIGEAGEVKLGRQRSPKYQSGKFSKPYLRVANVFDDKLDLSDVLEMDFDESDFQTYSLRPGDILLNEGQSRELVGRCAVFEDEVEDCCFQNTLVRFRTDERLLSRFAFFFFQYLFYKGVFASIASQTTSIAHLGAQRFARLYMPIPPKEDQRRIVGTMNDIVANLRKLENHLEILTAAKHALRESLLQVNNEGGCA